MVCPLEGKGSFEGGLICLPLQSGRMVRCLRAKQTRDLTAGRRHVGYANARISVGPEVVPAFSENYGCSWLVTGPAATGRKDSCDRCYGGSPPSMGINMFPNMRSAEEILQCSEGVSSAVI